MLGISGLGLFVQTSSSTRAQSIRCADVWPTDIWPTDTRPTDVWPTGLFTDRHLADRTFGRQDIWPTRHLADRTFGRQDIRPTGQFTDISIIWKQRLEITFILTFTHIYKLCAIARIQSKKLSAFKSKSLTITLNLKFSVW